MRLVFPIAESPTMPTLMTTLLQRENRLVQTLWIDSSHQMYKHWERRDIHAYLFGFDGIRREDTCFSWRDWLGHRIPCLHFQTTWRSCPCRSVYTRPRMAWTVWLQSIFNGKRDGLLELRREGDDENGRTQYDLFFESELGWSVCWPVGLISLQGAVVVVNSGAVFYCGGSR
jgi:hypothetical protein